MYNSAFDSIKGCGKMRPGGVADELVWGDGVAVPGGKPMPAPGMASSSLLYNEYVVYEESRVRIRFVCTVRHHFV